jgi:hypothetical protein
VALDAFDFLEHGARGVAKLCTALPQLEGLPQHEGQEAHQDMRLDPIGSLVPDREIGRIESSLFCTRKAVCM